MAGKSEVWRGRLQAWRDSGVSAIPGTAFACAQQQLQALSGQHLAFALAQTQCLGRSVGAPHRHPLPQHHRLRQRVAHDRPVAGGRAHIALTRIAQERSPERRSAIPLAQNSAKTRLLRQSGQPSTPVSA